MNASPRLHVISGDSSLTKNAFPDFISGFLLKPVNLQQLQELLQQAT